MSRHKQKLSSDSLVVHPCGAQFSLTENPHKSKFIDRQQHSLQCLRGLQDLYEKQQLCDVTLSVEGKNFSCHRSVLSACSDYFRAMFTGNMMEAQQDTVTLQGIDATSMESVLQYMYTGEAIMTLDNVQNVLSASNLFQLKQLHEGCANFMGQRLDVENCIGIYFFAQAHECKDLEYQAWEVISENFVNIRFTSEFLELPADRLVEIIRYDDLQATEEEVFEACLQWLRHNIEERSPQVSTVFSLVRFVLLDDHYLYDKVKSDAFLSNDAHIRSLLDSAIYCKLLRDRWIECDLVQEPRYAADYSRVVVYTAYLDDEKKQVLQLYGHRSSEVARHQGNVLCNLGELESPVLLVTGDNDLYLAGANCSDGSYGFGSMVLYKFSADDSDFDDSCITQYDKEDVADRRQFCLAYIDKHIYMLGGYCEDEGFTASVVRYSEADDCWDAVVNMPRALRCFCTVPYHGKLYVFGGECDRTVRKLQQRTDLNKQTFCFDPRTSKWTTQADMPTARALAGATVFQNKIYVIGGFGSVTDSWVKDKSPENCLKVVEVYDPDTNCWADGPELPTPLCAMGVVKYYGTIYLLGGQNDEDVSTTVYALNVNTHQWERKDDMIAGITETTIHSSYAVFNADLDY